MSIKWVYAKTKYVRLNAVLDIYSKLFQSGAANVTTTITTPPTTNISNSESHFSDLRDPVSFSVTRWVKMKRQALVWGCAKAEPV